MSNVLVVFSESSIDATSNLSLLAQLWTQLMPNASFWLTAILVVAMILLKDVTVAHITRLYFYIPEHIIQEVGQSSV